MKDLYLKACRRESTHRTPVWLMRQAGRYLPEYRALREKHDFLLLTREPELAAEVTLQPIRRFGFDAAILFADIITPLVGMGLGIKFAPGPVIANPLRSAADLEPLRRFEAEEAVPQTLKAVRILRRELDVPLIGFTGAPFTLACYLVDGKGTKDFAKTRSLMFGDPGLMREILGTLGEMIAAYARAQVEAGASAVQIFDTWAGLLAPQDFREFEAPALAPVFRTLRELGVPAIYYLNGCAALLGEIGKLDVDVAGIDWRVPLDLAREVLPVKMAVQGNLDPVALLGSPDVVRSRVRDVLRRAGDVGHIFNLGHGIHKETPPENVSVLVETVREETSR